MGSMVFEWSAAGKENSSFAARRAFRLIQRRVRRDKRCVGQSGGMGRHRRTEDDLSNFLFVDRQKRAVG